MNIHQRPIFIEGNSYLKNIMFAPGMIFYFEKFNKEKKGKYKRKGLFLKVGYSIGNSVEYGNLSEYMLAIGWSSEIFKFSDNQRSFQTKIGTGYMNFINTNIIENSQSLNSFGNILIYWEFSWSLYPKNWK